MESTDQEVARFAQFRRAGQTVGEYIAEHNLLRRKAGPEMDRGGDFPERSVLIFRAHNAGPSRQEKSLLVASSLMSLKFVEIRR